MDPTSQFLVPPGTELALHMAGPNSRFGLQLSDSGAPATPSVLLVSPDTHSHTPSIKSDTRPTPSNPPPSIAWQQQRQYVSGDGPDNSYPNIDPALSSSSSTAKEPTKGPTAFMLHLDAENEEGIGSSTELDPDLSSDLESDDEGEAGDELGADYEMRMSPMIDERINGAYYRYPSICGFCLSHTRLF